MVQIHAPNHKSAVRQIKTNKTVGKGKHYKSRQQIHHLLKILGSRYQHALSVFFVRINKENMSIIYNIKLIYVSMK